MKKILLVSFIIAALLLVWYLFIKEYDYKFKFGANSGPATAYQEIKNLGESNLSVQNVSIEKASPFSQLVQTFSSSTSSISMEWNFKYENDSVTHIEVNTVDRDNKFMNRLAILNPFQESNYVKELAQRFSHIKHELDAKQQTYHIRLNEITESPAFSCICTTSTNIPVEQKANEMLETIEIIEAYFIKYNLKLEGYPFIKVIDWNFEKETINFDFCFPVEVPRELEETEFVKQKVYPGLPSLKATFNGNYRQSHLAWYELLQKGKRENMGLDPKPLEVFFNNPRMGETAISWKAEIFMPLKN